MTFSKATLLGLKSLHVMCKNDSKVYYSVGDLSYLLECSKSYLNKVMKVLVKVGIIDSKTGPGKGYIFKRDPSSIKLIEVVQALENMSVFTSCFFGLDDCSDANPCVFHHEYDDFRNKLLDKLYNTNIVEASKDSWKIFNSYH